MVERAAVIHVASPPRAVISVASPRRNEPHETSTEFALKALIVAGSIETEFASFQHHRVDSGEALPEFSRVGF